MVRDILGKQKTKAWELKLKADNIILPWKFMIPNEKRMLNLLKLLKPMEVLRSTKKETEET